MHNSPHNRLFDFIKSKFDSAGQDEWNTPPDFIFDNAINQIKKEKLRKQKIAFKRGGFLFLFLLGVSSIFYINYKVNNISSEFSTLKSQKIELHDQAQLSNQDQQNLLTNKQSTDQEINSDTHQETIESNLLGNKDQKKVKAPIVNRVSNESSPLSYNASAEKVAENNIDLIEMSEFLPQNETTEIAKRKSHKLELIEDVASSQIPEIIEVDKISSLGLNVFDSDRSELDINASYSEVPNSANTVLPFTMGVSIDNNYSCFTMDNPSVNSDMSLEGYDAHNFGLGLSLWIKKPVSKRFSIVSSLGVNRINNQSELFESSDIDMSNFVSDGTGMGAYVTEMTIETPIGNYKSDVEIIMSESEVADTDKMINNTLTEQSLTYTSLDLGMQYDIRNESKLAYYLGSGITYNRILSMNSQFETSVFMDDTIMESFYTDTNALEGYNSSFLSYYLEAGVSHSLSNHSNVSLSFGINNSLTSLKSSDSASLTNSNLKQFTLGLGYGLKF